MSTGLSDIGTKVWINDAGVVADVDRIVTTANMKNTTTYTIAAQPDVPRNITVTHTAVGAVDTLGTIAVVGTDANDAALSETLTPSNGVTVSGTKAFKTVTSAIGTGWIIGEGNDTITIGVGAVVGYSYLVPVSKVGAVGGSMDKHESTALDDTVKTYTAGRLDTSEIEFTYNFNTANAARVKSFMDGTTSRTLIIEYPDHSGYRLVGIGTDTTSDVSTNSLLTATFSFVNTIAPVFDDNYATVIRPV